MYSSHCNILKIAYECYKKAMKKERRVNVHITANLDPERGEGTMALSVINRRLNNVLNFTISFKVQIEDLVVIYSRCALEGYSYEEAKTAIFLSVLNIIDQLAAKQEYEYTKIEQEALKNMFEKAYNSEDKNYE